MKSFALALICLAQLLHFTLVHADPVQAVQIHADYFPNDEYAIGLDVDPTTHAINQIYFEQNQNKTLYTFDALKQPTNIIAVKGIKLVSMQVVNHPIPSAATIALTYVQNYLSGSSGVVNVTVVYNFATGQYDVTDLRSNAVIHQVNVVTRYSLFHIPIGISAVNTQ